MTYITGSALVARWEKRRGSKIKALGKITSCTQESRLHGFHPICHGTRADDSGDSDFSPIELGLFCLKDIEGIEAADFSKPSIPPEATPTPQPAREAHQDAEQIPAIQPQPNTGNPPESPDMAAPGTGKPPPAPQQSRPARLSRPKGRSEGDTTDLWIWGDAFIKDREHLKPKALIQEIKKVWRDNSDPKCPIIKPGTKTSTKGKRAGKTTHGFWWKGSDGNEHFVSEKTIKDRPALMKRRDAK